MKNIISIVLFLVISNLCLGQVTQSNTSANNKYEVLSQEAVFVHYNTSLLFSGEYLYYKVYCVNSRTKNLSKISKIAYVELVGEDGSIVFSHKIELNDSSGYSDFFIPTSVPSGNYKLVAYTQWMKNLGGTQNLFQADIGIINPYRGDQARITTKAVGVVSKTGKNIDNQLGLIDVDENPKDFKLLLNKQSFGKREQVRLKLTNLKRILGYGNYSLSVKKIDPISYVPSIKAQNYELPQNSRNYPKGIVFAPESSGSLIVGRVLDKETNAPAAGQNVAISISGENFFFRVATSDIRGNFRFSLDPDYDSDTAIVQVVGDSKDNYKIEFKSNVPVDYSNLKFTSFSISPEMKEHIVQRSIYNQVENGFYSIKPDTIKPEAPRRPFTYYEKITSYNLDDYTRFNTMKEVFTEVVEDVWTGSDKEGNRVVKVRNYEYDEETEFLPLIFIDGVFVQNHNDLYEFNALKVAKVKVLRDRYKYGTQEYKGVILIETILKDYTNNHSGEYLKNLKLFKPQQKKSYFQQNYTDLSEEFGKRTPDFRSQLLWEPNISLTGVNEAFQFYTSDNVGEYEVALEGFTIEGKPISIREIFSVVE